MSPCAPDGAGDLRGLCRHSPVLSFPPRSWRGRPRGRRLGAGGRHPLPARGGAAESVGRRSPLGRRERGGRGPPEHHRGGRDQSPHRGSCGAGGGGGRPSRRRAPAPPGDGRSRGGPPPGRWGHDPHRRRLACSQGRGRPTPGAPRAQHLHAAGAGRRLCGVRVPRRLWPRVYAPAVQTGIPDLRCPRIVLIGEGAHGIGDDGAASCGAAGRELVEILDVYHAVGGRARPRRRPGGRNNAPPPSTRARHRSSPRWRRRTTQPPPSSPATRPPSGITKPGSTTRPIRPAGGPSGRPSGRRLPSRVPTTVGPSGHAVAAGRRPSRGHAARPPPVGAVGSPLGHGHPGGGSLMPPLTRTSLTKVRYTRHMEAQKR